MNPTEQSTICIEFLEHLEKLKRVHTAICCDKAMETHDFDSMMQIIQIVTTKTQTTECEHAMKALAAFKEASNTLFFITMMSIMTVEVERLLGELKLESPVNHPAKSPE